MDLKIMFIVVAVVAISYRTEVNSDADDYALLVCEKFDLSREKLYKFVTLSSMVDKWVDWFPAFIDADKKQLGVGKSYKAIFSDVSALFWVTAFDEGNYVAVESNFLFRPLIEFYFFDIKLEQRTGSNCTWQWRNSEQKKSQLEIRLTFKRSSALFQHTIGAPFRLFLRKELQSSLKNLRRILERSSSFNPAAYSLGK